jgi:ATP synthase protein I
MSGPPSREALRRGLLDIMAGPPRSSIGSLGALSAVGIAFVLAVGIGFLIGYWLDRWLGTSPLFMLLFFFIGVAAGIVNVVRTANAVDREEKR